METKVCSVCGKEKPLSQYNNAAPKRGKPYIHPDCKLCQGVAGKKWRETKLPPPAKIPDLPEEVWLPIGGIQREYTVSNMGRVKSMPSRHNRDEKLMRLYPNRGYLCVRLSNGEKERIKSVHRIVALHFIENPENKPEVNHKNGNKKDNRVENLEWATKSENRVHALLVLGVRVIKAGDHYNAKLNSTVVAEILESKERHKVLADRHGVSEGTIGSIKLGKTWGSVTGREYIEKDKAGLERTVLAIYASEEKTRVLSKRYGMSRGRIKSIRRGESYQGLTGGSYIAPRKIKSIIN